MSPFDINNLQKNVIHLWYIEYEDLVENINAYNNCLDQQELNKATKFVYKKNSYNFIKAHYCLRMLLSAYINIPAEKLSFTYNKYGKPYLANDLFKKLKFNMSHSDTIVLIAINLDEEIGCDIENIKDRFDLSLVNSHILSYNEIQLINETLDIKTKELLFCKIWTAKEALLKAEGVGLYIDLSSIDIKLQCPETQYKISNFSNQQWFIYINNSHNSYVYSIATKKLKPSIMLLHWSSYFARDQRYFERDHLTPYKL